MLYITVRDMTEHKRGRPPCAVKHRRRGYYLPETIHRKIREYAESHGMTGSAVVEAAVNQFLNNSQVRQRGGYTLFNRILLLNLSKKKRLSVDYNEFKKVLISCGVQPRKDTLTRWLEHFSQSNAVRVARFGEMWVITAPEPTEKNEEIPFE
jgi:hypothetical protein